MLRSFLALMFQFVLDYVRAQDKSDRSYSPTGHAVWAWRWCAIVVSWIQQWRVCLISNVRHTRHSIYPIVTYVATTSGTTCGRTLMQPVVSCITVLPSIRACTRRCGNSLSPSSFASLSLFSLWALKWVSLYSLNTTFIKYWNEFEGNCALKRLLMM